MEKIRWPSPQLYTVARTNCFREILHFSSAISVCLCLHYSCSQFSPQHHSLTNSGHDSCPDWGKELCYCYMRFAKCNGRSSEGWNTEQILFAVRKQDWKNSAVKTSMTKHETATAANEVCLVNSVLDEAPWNVGMSCPLIRGLDKLLAWGLGRFGPGVRISEKFWCQAVTWTLPNERAIWGSTATLTFFSPKSNRGRSKCT